MEGQTGGAEWHSILASAQAMVQRHQSQLADEIKTSQPSSTRPPHQPSLQSSHQSQQQQSDTGLTTGVAHQGSAGNVDQQDGGVSQSMAVVKQEDGTDNGSPKPEAVWLSDMVSGCVSMMLTMQRCAEQPVAGHAVNAALANSLKMLQPHAASNQPIFHKIEQMVAMLRNQLLQAS